MGGRLGRRRGGWKSFGGLGGGLFGRLCGGTWLVLLEIVLLLLLMLTMGLMIDAIDVQMQKEK